MARTPFRVVKHTVRPLSHAHDGHYAAVDIAEVEYFETESGARAYLNSQREGLRSMRAWINANREDAPRDVALPSVTVRLEINSGIGYACPHYREMETGP